MSRFPKTPKSAKDIFLDALDHEVADRETMIAAACAGDAALRRQVEALLRVHDQPDSLLDSPRIHLGLSADEDMLHSDVSELALEKAGAQIGPYRLLKKIGEGGFGDVYMADQTEPVNRCVALKIIKLGMDTRQVIARFEAERQALAMMDHINIATVLDAGTTDSGRPYFVMELVDGIPITKYCDEHHLTLKERLELFLPVCEAVQHAHQKGIVHRDIKPNNVLVAFRDERSIPKVIDFGLVKAVNQQLTEQTVFTEFGQIVGTIDYMSPEQADLNQPDIDTRSDIYSLGVLLYQLLTGVTPFDRQRLRSAAFDELLRIIREEEPPRPSARLRNLGQASTTISLYRRTDPTRLCRVLQGELDWIVMKALEKDRAQRYETAVGMAIDVRRYLADEPVRARPPSKIYRLRKFARRNKLMLAATTCVMMAMLAAASFGLVAHWRSLRETEARLTLQQIQLDMLMAQTRAEAAENDRLEAHLDSLVQEAQRLSSGIFPDFSRAVELLDDAIKHRPQDARLHLYRGSALYESGRNEEAIVDLERSLQLSFGDSVGAHWLIAKAARELGDEQKARRHWELAKQLDPDSNESLIVQALAMPYDKRGIELLSKAIERAPFEPLLYYYRGRAYYNLLVRNTSNRLYDAAIDDLEKALRARPSDVRIVDALCRCLVQFHFLADSGTLPLRRARQLLDTWLATEPENLSALAIMANWYLANDRPQEVIETCLRGNELAPRQPDFLLLMGWAARKMGRDEDAIEYLSQALNLHPQQASKEGSGWYVAACSGRATSRFAIGQEDLALHDLSEASRYHPPYRWSFHDWYNLISAHRVLGRYEEGLAWCDKYVQLAPECSSAYFLRGALRNDSGEREAAADDLVEAIRLNPASASAYTGLLTMYLEAGAYTAALQYCNDWEQAAPDAAAPYRWRGLFYHKLQKYEDALHDFDAVLERNERDARAYYQRGNTYVALRQHDKALADFDKAIELDPDDGDVPNARGRVHFDQKKYELAAADFSHAIQLHRDDAVLYRRRGETFYRLKQYEAALADLDRSLELDPRDATAYDRRGLVYAALGRHDEAAREYARALKLNPREPWTNTHLVKTFLTIKDYQEALRCCEAWSREEPMSSEPHRLSGTVYSESGNLQAALGAFARAVKQNPRDHVAHVERGRVYAALGQPAKALADYNTALELNPKYSAVYYRRGLANVELRRYQQAVADFTRALDYNGDKSWLYYHRAKACWRLGRHDEAMVDCRQAIRRDPDDATCVILLGRILSSQNRHAEALTHYLRALELDPDAAYVRDAVVKTRCALKDYAAALATCDQWVREKPDSNVPYRYRGFVHYCAGAYDKALVDYEQALERASNDYRCLLCRGQARLALKQQERGLADVERSVQLCPPERAASHLAFAGEVYGEFRYWHRARTTFARAVELDAQAVDSWYLLALVQLAQDDYEGYRDTCSRMLQQFGTTDDPACAELVARTCILQPVTGNEDQLLALANQAAENRPDDAVCRCTLGAFLFRTGYLDEALTHLQEAERLDRKSSSISPENAIPLNVFLAMAHHRQGNEQEAADCLSKAVAVADELPVDQLWTTSELPAWSCRLAGDMLCREAERMTDQSRKSNRP